MVGPGSPLFRDVAAIDWREPMSTVNFVERLDLRRMQKIDLKDLFFSVSF